MVAGFSLFSDAFLGAWFYRTDPFCFFSKICFGARSLDRSTARAAFSSAVSSLKFAPKTSAHALKHSQSKLTSTLSRPRSSFARAHRDQNSKTKREQKKRRRCQRRKEKKLASFSSPPAVRAPAVALTSTLPPHTQQQPQHDDGLVAHRSGHAAGGHACLLDHLVRRHGLDAGREGVLSSAAGGAPTLLPCT